MKNVTTLKAGTLIEADEATDSFKLPSRFQLARLETRFDRIPTYEVLRRLYVRHSVGFWQVAFVVTWVIVLVTSI
jgi:hypothetical protein